MRWFITKKHLVCLIGLLVAAMIVMVITGCIPVTIRPERDSQGLPIATPVTVTGSISPDGTLNPIYPVSKETPSAPPSVPWGAIAAVVAAAATGETLLQAVARTEGQVGYVPFITNLDIDDTVFAATANAVQAMDKMFLHHFASTTDIAGAATTNKNSGNTKTI